jgi:hypothetical protein
MRDSLKAGYQLPAASAADVAACETTLDIVLPDDYRRFLMVSNGFNDDVGKGYLVLWNLDELAQGRDYELFEQARTRFLIGSNGGPTAYGLVDGAYIAIPFVFAGSWQDEIRNLGGSFDQFIAAIERGEGW